MANLDELQNSSIVVSIASLIIALLVFVMDFTFGIQHISFGEFIWKGIIGIFIWCIKEKKNKSSCFPKTAMIFERCFVIINKSI
jgi:hypothetical protein